MRSRRNKIIRVLLAPIALLSASIGFVVGLIRCFGHAGYMSALKLVIDL